MGPCEQEDAQMLADFDHGDLPIIGYDRDFGEGQSGLHVDHRRAAYEATRHLLNLGHKRIALLSSSSTLSPGRARIAGYADALKERGIEVQESLIRAHKSSMDFVSSEALSLMSLRPAPPTAYISLGTRMLASTLQGLRQNGWRIPEDVSVLTVGDTDLARLFSPSITVVTWSLELVGEVLAELMLRRLDASNESGPKRIMIPTQMIERESCAKPGRLFEA